MLTKCIGLFCACILRAQVFELLGTTREHSEHSRHISQNHHVPKITQRFCVILSDSTPCPSRYVQTAAIALWGAQNAAKSGVLNCPECCKITKSRTSRVCMPPALPCPDESTPFEISGISSFFQFLLTLVRTLSTIWGIFPGAVFSFVTCSPIALLINPWTNTLDSLHGVGGSYRYILR